jgi:hypothetical protein
MSQVPFLGGVSDGPGSMFWTQDKPLSSMCGGMSSELAAAWRYSYWLECLLVSVLDEAGGGGGGGAQMAHKRQHVEVRLAGSACAISGLMPQIKTPPLFMRALFKPLWFYFKLELLFGSTLIWFHCRFASLPVPPPPRRLPPSCATTQPLQAAGTPSGPQTPCCAPSCWPMTPPLSRCLRHQCRCALCSMCTLFPARCIRFLCMRNV